MPLLTTKKEVVVALENIAGTTPASGLTTVGNANIAVLTAEPVFDVDFTPREFLRDTLTAIKQIPGKKTGGVTLTFELTPGTGTAAPSWGKLLILAGFEQIPIGAVTLSGAITTGSGGTKDGPIRHNEFVGDGTGSRRVIGDVHNGATILYFASNAGTSFGASGTLTAGDTGCTVAFTVKNESVGFAWAPVSESVKSIALATGTYSWVAGHIIAGATSGARAVVHTALSQSGATGTLLIRPIKGAWGNAEVVLNLTAGATTGISTAADAAETFTKWPSASIRLNEDGAAVDFVGSRGNISFAFEVNRPVKATFTSRGRWQDAASTPVLGGNTGGAVNPPVWAGAAVGVQLNEQAGAMTPLTEQFEDLDGEGEPCLTALSFDLGVQLSERLCASAPFGLEEIIPTTREGTGSVSGEATYEEDIPWLTALRSGEVLRLRTSLGSVATDDYFLFLAPGIQYTSASSGDRDKIVTRDSQFALTGGSIDNIDAASPNGNIAGYGGDNELILIYQFAAVS